MNNDTFGNMWFTRSQFTGQIVYGNSPSATDRLIARYELYCWRVTLIHNGIELTLKGRTLYGTIKRLWQTYHELSK